jgi:subtilisin family serine protease
VKFASRRIASSLVASVAIVVGASPALASTPPVEHATFHALGAPADPFYGPQWDLKARTTTSPGAANWQPAYEAGATGAGKTVAVIDTGVTSGQDLPNVAPGWNFVGGNSDAHDDNGHGTHVAGTVAQATNNNVGTAGIAGQATIVPVKVLDANGDGSDTNIIAGINWAVAQRVDVINLSLGGDRDGGTCYAVANAVAHGVTVVVASGNDGGPVSYPAACPGVIAVGATTITGTVASYSNRGPQLTITAPGGDMTTDVNGDGVKDGILQWSVFDNTPGYYLDSGTSMAAPHVAGTAAVVKQAWPAASPSQVRDVLTATAVDLGPAGRDDTYGAGLVDIGAAFARAQQLSGSASNNTTGPTTTTAPTTTDRVAGSSRYGTAAAIATSGWNGTTGGIVYLVSGNGFADALATGALSGRNNGPLLLTDTCSLPPETATALTTRQPASVTIVGGPNAVCDAVAQQVAQLTHAATTRVAGADRYATSVELSKAGWPQGSATVYLASGTTFADALGAATQAAHADAPLLLTGVTTLPDSVSSELRRLGATDVRVVGGTTAVGDSVVNAVRSLGMTVNRIAGDDRYATATAGVSQQWGTTGAGTVYLASGTTFPDGLAVGPLAAKSGSPLLLVPPCELPQTVADTLRALKPAQLVVVGGANAVCDSLLAKMGAAAASQ